METKLLSDKSIVPNDEIIFSILDDKVETTILQRNLPDRIKKELLNAKRYNTTRYIAIDVKDSNDFENVKKLIDLEIKN